MFVFLHSGLTNDNEESYQWQIFHVSPADLPEGKDPQFRIRTLIWIAL